MPAAALYAAVPLALVAAAETDVPGWLDAVSRVGVVGILVLALVGLHRKWWVPGWVYVELQGRHEGLRTRYDEAIELALTAGRGVQRTATIVEQALARASRER